ncbi:MAG TPA: sigma-70 family RNA polymerase sigma factor, partial [Treponemataceae bacterium]|nr:sigma-70 family RNA polymerase sigma factor [Treponemataceae bacterium]
KTQIISLPVRKEDLMYKIKTAKAELFQRSNTNPSDLEISVYTGIPLKMIEDTHSYDFSIASIDADVNNNSGQTLGDMLADVNQSPEDEVLREDKRKQIVNLVQMLPHNERIVIQNRYCLFSSEKKTLRQIGKILCLSPETVRQTEKRAIKKMRVVVDANSELYAI